MEIAATAMGDLPRHRVGVVNGVQPDVEVHPVLCRPLGLHLGTRLEQRAAVRRAWWPDARYTRYRPGQSGTVVEQARAVQYLGQGSPVFRSTIDAKQTTPATPNPSVTTPPSSGTSTSPGATPSSSVPAPATATNGTPTGSATARTATASATASHSTVPTTPTSRSTATSTSTPAPTASVSATTGSSGAVPSTLTAP